MKGTLGEKAAAAWNRRDGNRTIKAVFGNGDDIFTTDHKGNFL